MDIALDCLHKEQRELERELAEAVSLVRPVASAELAAGGQAILDNLTKPLGSLGRLEELALRLFLLGRGERPLSVEPAMLFTIAGDHGVVGQGVAANPQAVTRQMVLNFLSGGAGINAVCASAGLELLVVDAGVLGAEFAPHPRLVRAKIGSGTADLSTGPAMSRHECLKALHLGLALAGKAVEQGVRCLAAGEMGIGNTTPSTALYCAWLGLDPYATVGAGAGLPPEKLKNKADVIAEALRVHAGAIGSGDPLAVLAALGGFEIAVMSGLMLGAAVHSLPFLVDGFIAGAAFTAAWKIVPAVADYCFFAHTSAEAGHAEILRVLGCKPLLNLGLRLGEGTGAALAFPLLKAAAAIFNDMASFEQAGVTI